MVDHAFATVLRRLRTAQGLSQERLAERAGIHRTYVSQLERRLKSPTLNTIAKLADSFDLTLMEFITQVQIEIDGLPTDN